MIRKIVTRIVDASGRHPLIVLAAAILAIVGTWTYAYTTLGLNSDLLELLPRDSPALKAFEHQLGRVGGGGSLIVVVESPDRGANERFIDRLSADLDAQLKERKECAAACAEGDGACLARCPEELVAYVESGTKEVKTFFDKHKWLYADRDELEKADEEIDHQIAVRSGSVVDLFADDAPKDKPPAPSPGETKRALGLADYKQKLAARSARFNPFPSGYFATEDGKMMALRMVAQTRGLGDPAGDRLLARTKSMVDAIRPESLHPEMKVGFAGDIPNVVEEKEALLSDAAWATGLAFLLIVWGIIYFFRSPWALLVVFLPAFIGVGFAYAFATLRYGYVNATGAFLGAIILGNGINYPIVLLNRYREFRARGMTAEVARREAVINAFRAELVGATVASIAYGSLVVTRFRGFNQFGVIGFVGMLLVWVSMIPCVPALLVIDEWIQSHVPGWLRDRHIEAAKGELARGPVMKLVSAATARAPWLFLGLGVIATALAAVHIRPLAHDPWEYDFSKLGSRGTQQHGAGAWSTKADIVFQGKANIAGAPLLADRPEQVPLIKNAILDNDAKDPRGRVIEGVVTIWDLMPGTRHEQEQKIEILERMRSRLTPSVLHDLSEEERADVEALTPPEDLQPFDLKDLPALVRRRFQENDGTLGTLLYVQPRNDVPLSDGHVLIRIANDTDNLALSDGSQVMTASFWTVSAEIIRSMERDGPLASLASLLCVIVVVIAATRSLKGSVSVIAALVLGTVWALGVGAWEGMRLNFVNFIALPITFGIGSEYPFNIFDRSRLLGGDVRSAVALSGGAVALCSYTTTIGYSSLLFSDQMALQSFGRLAMAGEIACLLAALFFLPSLLHVMAGKRASAPPR